MIFNHTIQSFNYTLESVNLSNEDKEKYNIREIETKLNRILQKYNSDSDKKRKLREYIDKGMDRFIKDNNPYDYYDLSDSEKNKILMKQNEYKKYVNNKNIPKFRIYDIFLAVDSIGILISNENQYINSDINKVINEIGKDLFSELSDTKYFTGCDIGDGDEGCIYLNLKKEEKKPKEKSFNLFKKKTHESYDNIDDNFNNILEFVEYFDDFDF